MTWWPMPCPHLDYAQDEDYAAEMVRARRKGIKIFAVASSGMDQQGEYVFRQLAQQTMGRFLFILYRTGPQGSLETPTGWSSTPPSMVGQAHRAIDHGGAGEHDDPRRIGRHEDVGPVGKTSPREPYPHSSVGSAGERAPPAVGCSIPYCPNEPTISKDSNADGDPNSPLGQRRTQRTA